METRAVAGPAFAQGFGVAGRTPLLGGTRAVAGEKYSLELAGRLRRLRAMGLWRDVAFVWRGFVRSWRAGWKAWLGCVLGFVVLTGLVLFPNDLKLLRWFQEPEGLGGAEKFLAFWGDFYQFSVGWAVVLFAAGALRKDRWLRRAALAFLLAGMLSGTTTRIVKFSAGRARPTQVERKDLHWVTFRGPTWSPKYHAYVSGHTSSAMASAVALVIVLPRVGWVAVLFAAAVGWSRMYGNHHFPSDVVHGAAWGTMWGCLVGSGMARVRRRARAWKKGG